MFNKVVVGFLTLCVLFKNLVNCATIYSKFPENETTCKCVPAYVCDDDDVAVNGEGALDVRSKNSNACSNYFEVCCENPKADIDEPKNIQNDPIKGCGYQNNQLFNSRIISDGDNAKFGEFPWTVAIIIVKEGEDTPKHHKYRCGGSLIHPQVTVTAAHCVDKDDYIMVRAGEWDTRKQEEVIPHQDLQVIEIITHPLYKERSLRNDIALLIMIESFAMLENVGIICLAPQNFDLTNTKCTASGWGKDAFVKGKHSTILKKVDLPLVPRDTCQNSLRKTRLGPLYKLHDSFVCAGGEANKDTCKGDGGSPLVCPIPGDTSNRYFQMGIVSWGIGCGENQTPGVYANVPHYTEWIDEQLTAKNFDTTLYKW